jgi:ubiquinone biosynthesis protein
VALLEGQVKSLAEQVKRRIESELNGGIDTLFASFDAEPLGTASLGQAHAAKLPDGTDVVVKVLHEGIDASVSRSAARNSAGVEFVRTLVKG